MTALVSLLALARAEPHDAVDARVSTSDLETERACHLAARAATGEQAATRQLLTLVAPAVLRSVRLVLGSKHVLSGQWQAGPGAGYRAQESLSNRPGIVKVQFDGGGCFRGPANI